MGKTSNICAGIVLYNPDITRLKESLASIIKQVPKVFLVDNGSVNLYEVEKLVEDNPEVEIIPLGENMGIAAALNEICRSAAVRGYEWALTLDQDTICPEDLVENLYSATGDEIIGIVCPAVKYEGLNMVVCNDEETVCEIKGCMTSASLTNIAIWDKVGGFREDYFIDYVDNEYCKRLRVNGYKILRVNACQMLHQLGDARTVKFLFMKFTGSYHNPVRCYYMIRNNIVFIREYKKEISLMKEWIKVIYIALGCVFYAEDRSRTTRYVIKGIKDALKGKMGKYEG